MGGYVALAFLRNYGGRIKALVLSDTRPQADTPEGCQAREELAVLVMQQGSSAVAEQMLPRLLGPTTFQKRPELAIQVRRMVESISPAAIAAASRGMARRAESSDLLSRVSCPVLVISGDEDILTTPQAAEAWAKAIPNVSVNTIPAAGHLASLEQPEAFNACLITFLAGC
jgi:3-oxoadipate enol-lactonase